MQLLYIGLYQVSYGTPHLDSSFCLLHLSFCLPQVYPPFLIPAASLNVYQSTIQSTTQSSLPAPAIIVLDPPSKSQFLSTIWGFIFFLIQCEGKFFDKKSQIIFSLVFKKNCQRHLFCKFCLCFYSSVGWRNCSHTRNWVSNRRHCAFEMSSASFSCLSSNPLEQKLTENDTVFIETLFMIWSSLPLISPFTASSDRNS